MGLWQKLTNEFIDIVEWLDDSRDTLVHRFERYNNEIKNGAKLVVREGQLAIIVNQGQAGAGQPADVFGPGMHELSTANLPILSTLQGWKYGFNSPFKAEVYFFNTRLFPDLKWGTPGPSTMRDPDFGVVRVTAFGIYSIRIKDAKTVLKDLVGTAGDFTLSDIENNLRGKIGLRIKEVMPELGVPVIDLESKVTVLGERIREKISPDFERLGLELVEVQVQDLGLPEEVEAAIDKQGAMRVIGNMQTYAQYEAANAMRDAANNTGAAGSAMGVGVGMMMGNGIGALFGGGSQSPAQPAPQAAAPVAPPPLPTAVQYWVAINGQQAGPFDLAALQQKLASGEINRDSLAWKQGMPGWTAMSQIAELGSLFANVPPPLPPM